MINGEMSEAQKGYAVLEETDQSTFHRFVQWVYSGSYESGKPVPQLLDHSSSRRERIDASPTREGIKLDELQEVSEPPSTEPSWDFGMKKSKKGKKGSELKADTIPFEFTSRDELKESFVRRKSSIRTEHIEIYPTHPNLKRNEDYTEVFLSHAQLYVFAEKYDIQNLKLLALDKLHNVLSVFTLFEERTGDIIALLRYVYENTSEPVNGVEDLRTLLTLYVGYEMDTLMKDDGFRDLMIYDGGAIMGDFMKMVRKRIAQQPLSPPPAWG